MSFDPIFYQFWKEIGSPRVAEEGDFLWWRCYEKNVDLTTGPELLVCLNRTLETLSALQAELLPRLEDRDAYCDELQSSTMDVIELVSELATLSLDAGKNSTRAPELLEAIYACQVYLLFALEVFLRRRRTELLKEVMEGARAMGFPEILPYRLPSDTAAPLRAESGGADKAPSAVGGGPLDHQQNESLHSAEKCTSMSFDPIFNPLLKEVGASGLAEEGNFLWCHMKHLDQAKGADLIACLKRILETMATLYGVLLPTLENWNVYASEIQWSTVHLVGLVRELTMLSHSAERGSPTDPEVPAALFACQLYLLLAWHCFLCREPNALIDEVMGNARAMGFPEI